MFYQRLTVATVMDVRVEILIAIPLLISFSLSSVVQNGSRRFSIHEERLEPRDKPKEVDSSTKKQVTESSRENKWCTGLTDCGPSHVMCQFPEPGPNVRACHDYKKITISSEDRVMITHFVNYRRNLVAGGLEYKLPPASDMMFIEWDETLAVFAQRWADQCPFHPNPDEPVLTDFCRDNPQYHVAQVAARAFGESALTATDMMHTLLNRISSSNSRTVEHVLYTGYIPLEDEGAVLFYSKAQFIGCGASSYVVDIVVGEQKILRRMYTIYCNIGPLEEFYLLDKYYSTGEPCSTCPGKTICKENSYFKYLCQKQETFWRGSI